MPEGVRFGVADVVVVVFVGPVVQGLFAVAVGEVLAGFWEGWFGKFLMKKIG